MNYKDYSNGLFKFILPDEVINVINSADLYCLEHIGLPNRILSNEFVFYNKPIFDQDQDCLLLGKNTHVSEWELKMNIINRSIFYSGKSSSLRTDVYCYYNSNISKFLLCHFSYEFYVRRLIGSEALGPYYDNTPEGGNFGKYAELLKGLIKDIDEQATKEGAWYALIEEMSLGVL